MRTPLVTLYVALTFVAATIAAGICFAALLVNVSSTKHSLGEATDALRVCLNRQSECKEALDECRAAKP